ncbi:MAG: hypothetical protein ACE5FD_06860 [Anaerolineae bacterium]
MWPDTAVPATNYSVQLTIQHQTGETDILTGLLIGSETHHFTAATSPLGYAALWQDHTPPFILHPSSFILPPAPWPHVRGDANEIWLDVRDGRTTVRINREILWEGEARPEGEIGVFLASYGETAVVEVTAVSLFYD